MRIILIFRTLFVFATVDNGFCSVYLSLSDLVLVVLILWRVGYYKVLFQRLDTLFHLSSGKVFFYPSVLVENLVVELRLVNLIYVVDSSVSNDMPARRIKSKLFEMFRKLFYRLCCNKASQALAIDGFVVELSIALRGKSCICTYNDLIKSIIL